MQQSVLVCVTQQRSCERLVLEGARYARERGLDLHVVHVVAQENDFLENASDGEALDYLFGLARQYNASIHLQRADDVVSAIIKCANDNRATLLLVGQSKRKKANDLLQRLRQGLPQVTVTESSK